MRRVRVWEELEKLRWRVDYMIRQLNRIVRVEERQVSALDELTREVAETKGAAESAITLIVGLKAKLDEIIAGGNNDPALLALAADLDATQTAIADAVAANPIP